MSKTNEKIDSAAAKAAKDNGVKIHLCVLMDQSGSMGGLQQQVVEGCNGFLETFKGRKKTRVWTGFFDSVRSLNPLPFQEGFRGRAYNQELRLNFKHENAKRKDVEPLTIADYQPHGGTPLNDAIISTIEKLQVVVKDDENVFMAIVTDGQENSSTHTADAVSRIVKKQEEKGWTFVYVGANQDAEAEAAKIGLVKQGQAFAFEATGHGVLRTMSNASKMAVTRSSLAPGAQGAATMDSYAATSYVKTGGKLDSDIDLDDSVADPS